MCCTTFMALAGSFALAISSRRVVCHSLTTLLLSLSLLMAAASPPQKRMIEFGWDEPSTSFLRAHLTEMEQTPFDGCVFHVDYQLTTGERTQFTWNVWGKKAFTVAELEPAFADLKALAPRRFTHNFLRFNVTPGDIDWFEDFAPILTNARLAGGLARAGHAAGILFDVEPYNAPVFDFHKQRLAGTKSWEQYQTQARLRGREVMQAFQAGYPGLTVFLTFGYSIAWAQMGGGRKALVDCQYGLLPSFLDGLIDAAGEGTRVIDGCELAYGYRDTRLFRKEYDTMKTGLLSIVANPQKYHAVVSLGFGLWLDRGSHKQPWDTVSLTNNFYSPDQFQASVQEALRVTDEYVWIYTEVPRWWTESGAPTNLPPAYIDSVRQARTVQVHSDTH